MIITKRFSGIIRELPRTCCPTTHFEMHAANCHSTAWLVDANGNQIDAELAAKRLIKSEEEKKLDKAAAAETLKTLKIAGMGALGYHNISPSPPKKPQDFIWTFRIHYSNFSRWREPIYLNGVSSRTVFRIQEIVVSSGFSDEVVFQISSYLQRSFEIPMIVFEHRRFKFSSAIDADGIGNWSLNIHQPELPISKPVVVALVGALL